MSSAAWITQPTLFQFSQLRATEATTTDRITKLPLLGTLKCCWERERERESKREGAAVGRGWWHMYVSSSWLCGEERGEKKREREGGRWALETAGKVKMLQLLYLAMIGFNVYFTCLTESVCVWECMSVCKWTCACVCYQHATQSVAKATQKLQLWLRFHSNTASVCDSWRAFQSR